MVSGDPLRDAVRPLAARWEHALVVVALVAAALAIWLTLRAGFLAYPGWLAAQKADFILGPIGVGLYWRHKRPGNRLGSYLIVLGLLGIPYILQSSTASVPFGIGQLTEYAMGLVTLAVILAFPNGRLDGLGVRLLLAAMLIGSVIPGIVFSLVVPVGFPGLPPSSCRGSCPPNGLAIWSTPSWTPHLADFAQGTVIGVALATVGLLVWRFATGTPPRRRAMAIGAPIAVLFLLLQATWRTLSLISIHTGIVVSQPVQSALQWTFAGARALIWYGFLLALIAAELYAGRVLRTLVRHALRRPSFGELEGMLRGPLGDPGLRLGFWSPTEGGWVDADGAALEPAAGQRLTRFEQEPSLAVAIVHDTQLSEDPELLESAGEVALLALEHAELEAAQKKSLLELAESRTRLVKTSDRERRRLERDLHDGAQQRLSSIQIKLNLAREQVEDERLGEELDAISHDAEEAIDELRALSHGIYPTVLRSAGTVMALRALAMRAPIPIAVEDEGVGRCASAVEAAIYFCCAEALQNTIKHGGDGTAATVTLERDEQGIHFTIADDGAGMREPTNRSGDGLVGMKDRIGAVGGELEVSSSPGRGTTVRGRIPSSGRAVGVQGA